MLTQDVATTGGGPEPHPDRVMQRVVHRADAIKAQGKVSAGVDLALGLLLLAAGALLATGRGEATAVLRIRSSESP